MKLRLFPALALILLASCSSGSDDSSVSGDACSAIGFKIASGEQCFFDPDSLLGSPIVRLRIRTVTGDVGLCTGAAITPFKILTAAHCFIEPTFDVAVDTVYGTVSASYVANHPGFSFEIRPNGAPAYFNDVAVVTVPSPLPVSNYQILVGREPEIGEETIIAGFGVTSPDSDAGDLHAGRANIAAVTPNHIFIEYSADQSHPCVGDSGGPILVSHLGGLTIAGVVSQSDPSVDPDQSCKKGDVTLYANTQNAGILNFILQQAPDVGLR